MKTDSVELMDSYTRKLRVRIRYLVCCSFLGAIGAPFMRSLMRRYVRIVRSGIFSIALVGFFAASPPVKAEGVLDAIKNFHSQPKYTVVQTGIQVAGGGSNYNWCDNDHLFSEIDGKIYLVDMRKFTKSVIDFVDENGKPLGMGVPRPGACKFGKLLSAKPNKATETADDPRKKIFEIYLGPISGGRAERLLAPTERMLGVHLKAKYILAQKPKVKTSDGYKTVEECATYHHPDYKLLCIDTDAGSDRFFALERFIVAPYRWTDVAVVRGADRLPQPTKNQRPPTLDRSGRIIHYAIELRDLDFNLIARLTDDQVFKIDALQLIVSPNENFAYVPCAKRTESAPEGVSDYYGVCRYKLDGKQNQWQRVFDFGNPKEIRGHIEQIDVTESGDIYFVLAGARPPDSGIWKFGADLGKPTRITNSINSTGDKAPKVSRDGKQVIFIRTQQGQMLFIARSDNK